MPDWFYRTLARPVLFRLPAPTARDAALGFMGMLGRLPFGGAVIDFLGHMRAPESLGRQLLGVVFPSPVGLGPRLDANGQATAALSRFGVGFVEVGPITLAPVEASPAVERRAGQAVWFPDPAPNPGLDRVAGRLRGTPLRVPLIVRLGSLPRTPPAQAASECAEIVKRLAPEAALFSLDTAARAVEQGWSDEEWRGHMELVLRACRDAPTVRGLLVCVPSDLESVAADRLVRIAREAGVGGCLVDGSWRASDGGRLAGPVAREAAQQLARHLREGPGHDLVIVGSGGAHEPEDALSWLDAGADLVQVDTGLVYSGPGLPKRMNDALLSREPSPQAVPAASRTTEMTWFWTALMGAGMLVGSLLALAIAATRVVLPYDENFVGLTRPELSAVNPRLLDFMAHDRVSLAGTMVTIGALYLGLSLGGVRRGLHWAQQAIFASALVGFFSFFLFLGFGYFDPFHAFVSAILFQFFLLGLHSRLGPPAPLGMPNLREDGRWRASLWGQLLFVAHGFGLIGAGLAISTIGATHVFVPEDLEFMRTTAEALAAANPRLVPLVAHDRATFGGMLVSSGIAVLLPALWGYRQGARWLWWTFLASGSPAYGAAIGVHLVVGYTSLWHLAPAFGALGVFILGLALSRPYLCGDVPSGRRKES